MHCEECGTRVWRAGDIVPAGMYVRVDDLSYTSVALLEEGPLPATFDGHAARYRVAGVSCACMERAAATLASQTAVPTGIAATVVPVGVADPRH